MDAISSLKLQAVYPGLAAKVAQVDSLFTQHTPGDSLEVVQGFRNWQEQQRLYDQGRINPGKIVTDAPPGHSWHEYGLAVDVCPQSLLATRGWGPESPLWKLIASLAEQCGLVSGSCWHHQDLPHLQLTGRFPESPDDEARQLIQSGGVTAVWQAAFSDG